MDLKAPHGLQWAATLQNLNPCCSTCHLRTSCMAWGVSESLGSSLLPVTSLNSTTALWWRRCSWPGGSAGGRWRDVRGGENSRAPSPPLGAREALEVPWEPPRARGPAQGGVHLASLCAVSKSLVWASEEPKDFPQCSRIHQKLPNLPRPVSASDVCSFGEILLIYVHSLFKGLPLFLQEG